MNKLKNLMEIARKKSETNKNPSKELTIIASRTDRFGNEIPTINQKSDFDNKKEQEKEQNKKPKFVNKFSSKDGKYFVGDDKYSFKESVERVKHVDDNSLMFSSLKSKVSFKYIFFFIFFHQFF